MVKHTHTREAGTRLRRERDILPQLITEVGRIWAALCFAASAAAWQTPDQQSATFHAGTRLVEVEVVVR